MISQNAVYRVRKATKRFRITPLLRFFRILLLFGPWRTVVRKFICMIRPPRFEVVVPDIQCIEWYDDATELCMQTRRNSVVRAGIVDERLLKEITSITNKLPVEQYQEIHKVDPNIRQLVEDPGLNNLIRRYFRSEPIMLECTLFITSNEKGASPTAPPEYHFDYATWDFLNIFVYLTDVRDNSAYHEVVEGSHRNKTLRDCAFQPAISIDEVARRFGQRFRALKGQAGSIYMENTEAFHRRKPSTERRVMLNILYASCPDIFCKGRTLPANIRKRDQQYSRLLSGLTDRYC